MGKLDTILKSVLLGLASVCIIIIGIFTWVRVSGIDDEWNAVKAQVIQNARNIQQIGDFLQRATQQAQQAPQ